MTRISDTFMLICVIIDDIARAVEACKTKLIMTTPQLQSKVKAALDDSGHVQVIYHHFSEHHIRGMIDTVLVLSKLKRQTQPTRNRNATF